MIEVKNVTKTYGKFVAVDDISFKVKNNEIVGFLGPNGAGKTTTMNMITGYIEPNYGEIIINGYDISKSPKNAKKNIGYMPENVPLYNELTVKEFIKYMAELKNVKRKEREIVVNQAIEEAGLNDVKNKLIKKISRGYRQRTSLAGALVGNPDILILDEPTVGLDPKQITEIRNLIKKLGKKHTILLSSHILSEVSQICKKVIIINKGKILAIDTPENLEKQTQVDNSIMITVEDKNDRIQNIKKKIKEIKEIKFIKDNEDGTKQFLITAEKDVDIRKRLFDVLAKEDITIFELKQSETTLEDAFLKVINNKKMQLQKEKNLSQKENKQNDDSEKEINRKNEKVQNNKAKEVQNNKTEKTLNKSKEAGETKNKETGKTKSRETGKTKSKEAGKTQNKKEENKKQNKSKGGIK